jgi:hypothetical protein
MHTPKVPEALADADLASLGPGGEAPSLETIRELAALGVNQEAGHFIAERPALFLPSVIYRLKDKIDALPEPERTPLLPALEICATGAHFFEGERQRYPIGLGPIEAIFQRIDQGEISAEQGKKIAAKLGTAGLVSLAYFRALSWHALTDRAQADQWRPALQIGNLLIAACESLNVANPDLRIVRTETYLDYLLTANAILLQVPDGRVLKQAVDLGTYLVEEFTKADERTPLGQALHRLGTLYLDPYTAHTNTADVRNFAAKLPDRLVDLLGPEALEALEEAPMPTLPEALGTARGYYERATRYRDGHGLGLTLKALAQTLIFQHAIGETVEKKEIAALLERALTLIDAQLDPQSRAWARTCLVRFGETDLQPANRQQAISEPHDVDQAWMKLAGRDPAFADSFDETVRRVGAAKALELVRHGAQLLGDDPEAGLAIFGLGRPLLANASEEGKGQFWNSEVSLLARLPGQLGKLLHDARQTIASNHEEDGLVLLKQALEADRHLALQHQEALLYFEAAMLINASTLAEKAGQQVHAVGQLFGAADILTSLRLANATLDCLGRIDDDLSSQQFDVAALVIANLLSSSLTIENAFGPRAIRPIQTLVKHAHAVAATDRRLSTDLGLFVRQIAKGRRFAQVLAAPWTPVRLDSSEDEQILANARAAEAEATLAEPAGPDLVEESVLTAYMAEPERRAGATPSERMANLQQAYDERIDARMQPSQLASFQAWTEDLVRGMLPERSVLVDIYMAVYTNGSIANYVLAMAKDDTVAAIISHPNDLPDSEVFMTDPVSGRQVALNPQAFVVQDAREFVVAEPGIGRLASREALERLKVDRDRFLPQRLLETLELWREQGKDHLCFVPHGPTHYYPFHLLGGEDAVLADHWTITYLPNLRLLARRSAEPRPLTVAALGLTFKQSKVLPVLELSETEVASIAHLFGVEPLVDQKATRHAFEGAVAAANAIHISTHGAMNTAAPSFQCLYLAPEGDSDGRLFAFDVLGMDLGHVELLTLSACETSLGRFDLGDNLRGLPAAFLAAGVKTLVGTLWPVHPEPSLAFFSALYESLAKNASKLNAFRTAQLACRLRFPHYRDWGAFYFIGDWS